MKMVDFLKELQLQGKALSIILTNKLNENWQHQNKGCSLKLLNLALEGKPVLFSAENVSCSGAASGLGLVDTPTPMPGGMGAFLSQGAGEGFPPGLRIKANAKIAEEMSDKQPKNVVDGHKYIVVKPYEDGDNPTLVTFLINCDQLAALTVLFLYRKSAYDRVYAPMSSGCASIFRIPLGENKSADPRAVIGNIDLSSRPFFAKDTLFFTVNNQDLQKMLVDADHCFFKSPSWQPLKKRL
ncbi:MAG: DUF169 domain-containing protein [Bacillota bacterium]|jgi:hypothetical protein